MKQKSLDEKGEWKPDPEPEPEKPKEFVNIKWDKIGNAVEGIYKSFKEDPKFGFTYFLEDKNGKIIYSVPGTADINIKMRSKNPGDILKIEYIDDEDIGKASPLKKFKFYTWD